ncbi:DUF2975 domain-containing protein [Chitinophaga agrisoli]|uniref:DUF2975 domain-containing protein n=1 Tax=Chitinophaga agrisoli TaxID=2607653 RepID=A0A5B2W0W2_9BACT|nr:DUF2975 domain-containing protein [Chitinophaga agrisoli]KAA2245653.1 DUF2975 domain-containing protein [Chitinophaga agrisoli]
MKQHTTTLLRVLFWLLNIVIAGIVLFALFFAVFFFRNTFHANIPREGLADSFKLILLGILIQGVYLAGLVYILVQVNRIVYRILKGNVYDDKNLYYLRRISYLLLLAPVPHMIFGMILLLGAQKGTGFMMLIDSLGNYWPYCLVGLGVLVLSEIYKKGIAYKRDLELTI